MAISKTWVARGPNFLHVALAACGLILRLTTCEIRKGANTGPFYFSFAKFTSLLIEGINQEKEKKMLSLTWIDRIGWFVVGKIMDIGLYNAIVIWLTY